MGLFSFGKHRIKRFEYPPRYFNPEKEAFKARMHRIEKEVEEEENTEKYTHKKPSIRDAYDRWHRSQPAGKNKSDKIRLLIIVLSAVFLIIFFYLLAVLTTYILNNG